MKTSFFGNFLTGPVIAINNIEGMQQEVAEHMQRGWLPIGYMTRGEMVERMKSMVIPQDRDAVKYLVIFMSVKQLYYDDKK